MTKISALVIAAALLTGSSAFAGDMTPSQQKWATAAKACLVKNKVVVDGPRPECYLSDTLRLRCLTPELGKIADKCNQESLPGPTKQVKW